MIKLDGWDSEIDDKTIKFYADGGTEGSERATINSSMIHLRLDTNQMGVFNGILTGKSHGSVGCLPEYRIQKSYHVIYWKQYNHSRT